MKEDCLRILQVTDSHLYDTLEGRLLGMNTQKSLVAVLDCIHAAQGHPYDCILATGDLSQDGSIGSYERFKSLLAAFNCPQYWIPGNHDRREAMEKVAGDAIMPTTVRFQNWQLVLLDSQVPGKVGGNLADDQLDILKHAVNEASHLHTLVCLHHQPWPMGCKWLDPQMVKSRDQFNTLVEQSTSIKGVMWGHVHQSSDEERFGARYLSAPSTCVQFKPKSDDFGIDIIAPGYRWLHLYADGRIETGVTRVEGFDIEIDANAKGY